MKTLVKKVSHDVNSEERKKFDFEMAKSAFCKEPLSEDLTLDFKSVQPDRKSTRKKVKKSLVV